jgi:hypothetical protein
MHGGWLIPVPVVLVLDMGAFREGSVAGLRVVGPPFGVLSVVFGAGAAWTLSAQQQVGAIKHGAEWLPTLNLTCDAFLSYVGKTLSARPHERLLHVERVSDVRGALGASLVSAMLWITMRRALFDFKRLVGRIVCQRYSSLRPLLGRRRRHIEHASFGCVLSRRVVVVLLWGS